jgi:hypothetical protein
MIFVLGMLPLQAAQADISINLRTAGSYQILAGAAITVGAGTVGLDPATDGISASAVADLNAAISQAAGLSGTAVSADLGGAIFTPGDYLSPGGAAFTMTGNLTLSGSGPFVFYTPAGFNITAGIVILLNGATPRNIFWIAGGAITIGASSTLEGIFMSSAAITTGASNTFTGCLLATAAVTIGASNIFNPCPLTEVILPTGTLLISAPSICIIPDGSAGSLVTVESGDIVVTDSRAGGSATSWIVSVTASGLTNSNFDVIPPSAIAYIVTRMSNTGGISTISTNWANLSSLTPSEIVAATGAITLNTSTWRAQLKILIPDNQAIGAYEGIITHSVY